jgi:3D-(3,5/4)-trihydroxycyclohexane-1,2-dione acylhydrolase (decyclizing)
MTKPNYGETIRLTVAQAIVLYISNQYSVSDFGRQRFVPASFGIFGHGNVAGLGQALDEYHDKLPFMQGRNEQALAHAAIAFAKERRRTQTIAVTASVGPGAMNLITAAALATVNRIPVLLLPGDVYATRRQGPVLQQLENFGQPDVSVNDAFRPVSKFFDRITRPEQLLTALPQAFRILANPVETGAVVLALPQDVQSHAFDYPKAFFEPRDWKIRRPIPEQEDIASVAKLIKESKRPLIIAGGGVIYSGATEALEKLANQTGLLVSETFGGKSAIQNPGIWHLGGIGLEGTPATNLLANQADMILHIGTRLTDFATGSQSIFHNPDVAFASINVTEGDAIKQGATAIVADARLAIEELTKALEGYKVSGEWSSEAKTKVEIWNLERAAALNPDVVFDKSDLDPRTSTDAVLTQAQLIGVLQEKAQSGDLLITAAGGPPGDIQKVWDATGGRFAHLEFGFSCMGYEIPAAIGARLAHPDPRNRITSFIGDGTFVMAPTEIVSAAQEGLSITIVVSENRGYQVIRRLQMWRVGHHFANEFRYREAGPILSEAAGKDAPRLEGDYLNIDIVAMAEGMGAKAFRPVTASEFRQVLDDTRDTKGPVVIVVPTIPHVNLPGSGVWWDVAPAEASKQPWLTAARNEYNEGLVTQRWHG